MEHFVTPAKSTSITPLLAQLAHSTKESDSESHLVKEVPDTETNTNTDTNHVLDDTTKRGNRKEAKVQLSIQSFKSKQQSLAAASEVEHVDLKHRKFLSKMEDGQTAEAELSRNLSREDFLKMELVGQFNLGFLLTRLGDDLFIVDQHAADEKCTFERLEKAGLLERQAMVVPQPLELTAAEEELLLENMDTFTDSGFEFSVVSEEALNNEDDSDGGGKRRRRSRVSLTKVPHYRGWVFGKDDVDELLFMLSSGDVSCGGDRRSLRPSRVRSMLASRACRSSVMVGTALSRAQMRRLLVRMAATEQPWNCPHGRPTMRHLVNLNLIPKQ